MLAATSWLAAAEGDRERAVKLMRAAADAEDGSVKHVAMEGLSPNRSSVHLIITFVAATSS
jgi:hypothetical protein